MKRTLVACFVIATLGYSGPTAAATLEELERRAAASPDGRFGLAFSERLSLLNAAVDDAARCERNGRARCLEVAQEALRVAQDAATFAARAEVSPRWEPFRFMAEAGFRLMSIGLSNLVRWYQTYQRDALRRAGQQVSEAEDLLLGAAGVAQRAAETAGEAPRELPSSAQVQQDVDGFVAAQKARGVSVEDVFITFIVPDVRQKDLAHAQARGEAAGADERNRWRLVMSYRKVRGLWKLERLEPERRR